MAFPTVAGTATSFRNSNSLTDSVTLPSSVAAGDLIIVLHGSDTGPTRTWPGSWVELKDDANGANMTVGIAYLIASGGETSVTVTKSVTERFNAIAFRITGWHGTTPPEVTAAATGASTAPDSGSLTPSWGADDTLWLSAIAIDNNTSPLPVTAWPTGYTHAQVEIGNGTTPAGSSSSADVAMAARQLNAATEDPGAYTTTNSDDWNAYTIAVRPAAAAGTTATPGVLSVATAAFAPKLDFGIVTGKAALTLTTFAPQIKLAVVPTQVALATTTFAPTVAVSDNKVATIGLATLATSTLAPTATVSDNKTTTIGLATLATSPLAPTVTASDHKTVAPGVATLSTTGYAPSVGSPVASTPDVVALSMTAFAPTVVLSDNQVATVGLATLATTGLAPVVSTPRVATPDAPGLALTAFAPTVVASDHKTATPASASLLLTAFAPTADFTISDIVPGVAALVLTGYAPTIAVAAQIHATPARAAAGRGYPTWR